MIRVTKVVIDRLDPDGRAVVDTMTMNVDLPLGSRAELEAYRVAVASSRDFPAKVYFTYTETEKHNNQTQPNQ